MKLRSDRTSRREPASHDPAKLALGFVRAASGVGMGLFGLSNLRKQRQLLRGGVPTVGWITQVEHSPKSLGRLTFRFEDDSGLERESTYATFFAEDEYVVGQEVIVVYDGADSSKHMLDMKQVRREEAETRRG